MIPFHRLQYHPEQKDISPVEHMATVVVCVLGVAQHWQG